MNRLLEIDFIKVDYWEFHNSKLSYSLDASFYMLSIIFMHTFVIEKLSILEETTW